MNEICVHAILAVFIEKLRKAKKVTIEVLSRESHISTKTYVSIKKGGDARLSAYESLLKFFLGDMEEWEIREVVNEWLDEWLIQSRNG